MDDLQPGQQIGPYRLIGQIGQGGMATVFKAYQSSMDRYVALKVLPREFAHSAEFRARFAQEARVIANLEHAHILPVYDFGESEGVHYFVMRLLEAGTLKDRIKSGQLALNEIDELFTQLADALGYAHQRGIIHRDIKPSNVLVDQHDDAFLTDFGIAKIVEGSSQFTGTGTVTGTPDYMSPEQGRGEKLDQRSDIYSLGVVLYEMVTGRTPFEAETPLAVILKHMSAPLPLPSQVKPDVSPAVERVILKALSKERQDRYGTCAEFISGWKAAVAETRQRAQTAPMPSPVSAPTNTFAPPPPASNTFTNSARPNSTYPMTPVAPSSASNNWMPFLVLGLIGLCLCGLLVAGASSVPFIAAALQPNTVPTQFVATPLVTIPTVDIPTIPPVGTLEIPTAQAIPTNPPFDTPAPENEIASLVWSVGSEGTEPGQFDDARYLAVDGDGNIYVGEHKQGSRIQVFDSDGDFVTEWQIDSDAYLTGLAADADGKLYAVLTGDIYVYDGTTGDEEDQFSANESVAALTFSPEGELYAVTSASVVRFDENGEATPIVADFRNMIDEALSPSGIAVDEDGNIYVVGSGVGAVLQFSADGSEVTHIGEAGSGEGQFMVSPEAIAVVGGHIYTSGFSGVQVHHTDGSYLGLIPLEGYAFGLVVTPSDEGHELVVMDRNAAKLSKYQLNQ